MPPRLRAPACLLRSVAAALVLTALFALASLLAASRPPEDAAARLRVALAEGSLLATHGTMALPLGQRLVPVWESNDCLVLMMLVLPHQGFWRDAFSPRIPERLEPLTPGEPIQARCDRLAELLTTDPDPPAHRYDRYLHGQRVLGALLLPALGAERLRQGIAGALAALLGGLALLAGARAWRGGGRREAAFAWCALALLLFHALPMLGRYWTHALSDIMPALLLWALYLRPAGLARAALLGALGAAVAIYEFLTGQLPLSAALILLAAAAEPEPPRLPAVALDLAGFGLGAVLPFALKAALGALVFADVAAGEASGSLLHRILGPVVPEMSASEAAQLARLGFDVARLDAEPWWRLPYVVARLGYFAFVPGAGLWRLGLGGTAAWLGGLALLAGSAGVLGWGWRRAGTHGVWALAACAGILGWYLLFLNHTLLHTAWMARLLVVLPMAAGVVWLWRPRAGYGRMPADRAALIPSAPDGSPSRER